MKKLFAAALIELALAQPAFAASPLSKIVTPDLLGVTIKFAEHQIGVPARKEKVDGLGILHHYYERQGCSIFVGTKDDKVVSVGANIPKKGGKCDIDVSNIVNKPGTMASKTVFKDYAWRGILHFTNDQIPSCNACGEGTFNAMIDGYSALGSVDIRLEGFEDDKWEAFADYMLKNGMDYDERDKLPMTGYDCPLREYDAIGYEYLKNTRVIAIEFGRYGSLQPQCSGAAVHDLILRND